MGEAEDGNESNANDMGPKITTSLEPNRHELKPGKKMHDPHVKFQAK